jgi:hypothetical protein
MLLVYTMLMNKTQTQIAPSKTTGGYNAALAVPGHGLYAFLVLLLTPVLGVVPALVLVVAPYMYVSAKIYNRQQSSAYLLQLQMAAAKRQARKEAQPKLRLTPLFAVKKPKTSFGLRLASPKPTLFSN